MRSSSYDGASQLTVLVNPQGGSTTFSYDSAGRRTLKELANATRASFTYDDAGQLTQLANLKSDDSVISMFEYTVDPVGNRTNVVEASGDRVTWSYDKTYQLTREQRSGDNAYDHQFTYDPVGNRLVKDVDGALTTSTYDPANQLETSQAAAGVTTYTFDENGNQQIVEEPDGGLTTNTWDFENQTTLVELPAGTLVTMAYNAINRRVEKQSDSTTKFFWDFENDSYLLETDESGLTLATYTGEPVLYGNLLSQERSGTASFYHFDGQGSTRAVTDYSGNVTGSATYVAFGEPLNIIGNMPDGFRYIGYLGCFTDHKLNSIYMRARHYGVNVSRFLSLDRLLSPYGNRYSYTSNNPTTRVDPSGYIDSPPDFVSNLLGVSGFVQGIVWFFNPTTGVFVRGQGTAQVGECCCPDGRQGSYAKAKGAFELGIIQSSYPLPPITWHVVEPLVQYLLTFRTPKFKFALTR